jgi:surfactin synthase thioesterase subunit
VFTNIWLLVTLNKKDFNLRLLMSNNIFIIPIRIASPKLRIFCFPFAGGSSTTYMPWLKHFSDEIELVFVQPPGRGSRMGETPHDNMSDLIEELMLQSSYITSTRYILFGHSLGSRVAYELTCQLKSARLPLPEHFIASGSRAPHLPCDKNQIYDLPQDEFIKELEKLNGTPTEILKNLELMNLLTPLLRADFKIADNYRANRNLMPFPISILHGKNDFGIELKQAAAWDELSEQKSELIQLSGDHFFINQNLPDVLEYVSLVANTIIDSENISISNSKTDDKYTSTAI